MIRSALRQRLPPIIKISAVFFSLQVSFYIAYTTQRVINITDPTKYELDTPSGTSILMLSLEFIYSVTCCVTIWYGQPARNPSNS